MTHNEFGTLEKTERQTADLIVVAYVRILDEAAYRGEYGFDWLDIHVHDKQEVEKIQGVPFSNIEYFYKPPENLSDPDDHGHILPRIGNDRAVKDQIKSHYPQIISVDGKFVDQPHILIKKDQEITLALRLKYITGKPTGNEIVKITSNARYDIEIVAGEKNGLVTQINLAEEDITLSLKIKCTDDTTQANDQIPIMMETMGHPTIQIGGFVMMENTPKKLRFRVIALVSNEGNTHAKAKALFKKFKEANITTYLNTNSLNQAGYEIEIENQSMFDTLDTKTDLEDYIYAFKTKDWIKEGHYIKNFPRKTKTKTGTKTELCNVLSSTSEIDITVIEAYHKKLKKKKNDYNEGLIILADYKSDSDAAGAFSYPIPLDYYALFVYWTNIEEQTTYAHEIGHMLGLMHTFFETEQNTHFNNLRVDLISAKKRKEDLIQSKDLDDIITNITATEHTIEKAIHKSELYFNDQIKDLHQEKAEKKKIYAPYKNSQILTFPNKPAMTKKEYFDTLKEKKDTFKDHITKNREALKKLKKRCPKNYYIPVNDSIHLEKEQLIAVLEEDIKYRDLCSLLQEQNDILFKKNSTNNIMDDNSNTTYFSSGQIKTMREKYIHYKNR